MVIGIDFGSSFLKFAQLGDDGSVADIRRMPTRRVSSPDPRRAEYALAEMMEAAQAYIDTVMERGTIPTGILISTQMHGFVLREADGRVSNYISWQDELSLEAHHGETPYARLHALVDDMLLRGSGIHLKTELALCSLYARAFRGEVHPTDAELFTLGSYLIHLLCGRNITHLTNAAPTGMYDLRAHCWNQPLLDAVGFTGLRLPEVTDAMRPCGHYRGIPIYPDVGDQQASLLGAGLHPGQISINLGTASQVSILTDTYDESYFTGVEELRPFFGGQYLRTVSKLSGGRSLQVLVEFIRQTVAFATGELPDNAAVWDKIGALAHADSEGLCVSTGFFPTQLFPTGSIQGIDAQNLTPQNLLRGAFADLADRFGRIIDQLDPQRETDEILLSGGRLSELILPYLEADAVCGRYSITIADTGEAIFAGLKQAIEEE